MRRQDFVAKNPKNRWHTTLGQFSQHSAFIYQLRKTGMQGDLTEAQDEFDSSDQGYGGSLSELPSLASG
jgi:hypothetical protein